MNLKLLLFKNDDLRDYSQARYIRFIVVDLDKSKNYPANYVCLLPQGLSLNKKAYSVFSKLFGDGSLDLAKKLLTKALKTEKDSEIKREIERRISLLEPKPALQVKCRVCGNSFEPKRRGSKQKICQECKQKRYTKQ
jgi:hypothetical protein